MRFCTNEIDENQNTTTPHVCHALLSYFRQSKVYSETSSPLPVVEEQEDMEDTAPEDGAHSPRVDSMEELITAVADV